MPTAVPRPPVAPDTDHDEPLAALLRAVLAELRGLRADLAPPRRRSRVVLLAVIATAVQGRMFNAAEIVAHARINPVLAQALAAAGITTARSLGHYLRQGEGRAAGPVRVRRIGEDRDGLIWQCEFCR